MGHPLIVLAAIPGGVCVRPAVRQVLDELQAEILRSRMEGQKVAVAVRLVPYGLARGEGHWRLSP